MDQTNFKAIEKSNFNKIEDETSIEKKKSLTTNPIEKRFSNKVNFSLKSDSKILNEKNYNKDNLSYESNSPESSLINENYFESKPVIESIQDNSKVLTNDQENQCNSFKEINESSCNKIIKSEKIDIQHKSPDSRNTSSKSFGLVIEKKQDSESFKPENSLSLHGMTLTSSFVSTEFKTGSPIDENFSQSFEKLNYSVNANKDSTEANALSPKQTFLKISETSEQKLNLIESNIETALKPGLSNIHCEIEKKNIFDDPNINLTSKHESNLPIESNDIGIDNICMPNISLNNSVFCEDETVISSYVPETPENQERDQDQESALSSSSYEIPPCEELNFNNSSPAVDSTNMHNNSILEMSASSYGQIIESNSISMNLDQTSCYENQTSENHSVSPTLEILNSIKNSDEIKSQHDLIATTISTLEANSKKFITTCCNFTSTSQINLYSQEPENISNYIKSITSDKTSAERSNENKTEEENFFKQSSTQENDQNFVQEFSNYVEDGETSSGYYDSCLKKVITQTSEQNCYGMDEFIESRESVQDMKNFEHSESNPVKLENMTEPVPVSIDYEDKNSAILITEDTTLNKAHLDNYTMPTNFMN